MADSRVYRNALPTGSMLQEYRLESVLGAGGFGMTYLGWDIHLEKHVAIKEYLPIELSVRALDGSVVAVTSECEHDYKWGLERFILEARTLAKFSHPHIVRVMRFFEANSTGYMVMEYEKGEPFNELLKREQYNEPRLKEILMPLLDGLQAVHSAGFLHRDIKPANIFLREGGTPVLIDFGAARQAVGGATKSLTSVLTPGYAPLEQYSSDGHQGPWSDIYAMGGVLYRALTNENPPDAVSRIKNDTVPSKLGGALGRATVPFLRAVEWSLALDEKQRPQNIAEWRRALAGGPVPVVATRSLAPAAVTARSDANSAPTVASQTSAKLESRRAASWQPLEPEEESSGSPWGWALVVLVIALLGFGMWHKQSDSKRAAEDQRTEQQRAAAEQEDARMEEERKAAERARTELQEARTAEAEQRQRIAERDERFTEAEQQKKLAEREARVRELEQRAADREAAVKRSEEEQRAKATAAATQPAQAAKAEAPRERPSREREERPGGSEDDLMRKSEQDFRSADGNGDGYLDRREVERFPFVAKEFQRIDADGDGRLSQQEFLRAREEMARRFMKK